MKPPPRCHPRRTPHVPPGTSRGGSARRGGRILPSTGAGFVLAGTLPRQEAGAPEGLAPRQHRGGQSKTANKQQNLPF